MLIFGTHDEQTLAQLRDVATRAERVALGYMHPGRADVIAGGAVVFSAVTTAMRDRLGIETAVVSEHDILDGIALSLL